MKVAIWEYRVMEFGTRESPPSAYNELRKAELAALGNDCWEVVCVVAPFWFLLKRPKGWIIITPDGQEE